MSAHPDRATVSDKRASPPALACAATVVFALTLAAVIPVAAISGGSSTDAQRLHADLGRMAKFANRTLRPPLLQLARDLPGAAERLEGLRQPATTAESELRTTLSELRQMRALTLDPHYVPALVAAGRAYLAVSGKDPIALTTVNPDYQGLESEIAADAAGLGMAAATARKATARVKRLARALQRAKRRANRLQRQIACGERRGAAAGR